MQQMPQGLATSDTGVQPYALISVSDKSGVEVIAKTLVDHGLKLLSTGGTLKYLRDRHGLPVTAVSDVTQYPEILNGRVKTLHPAISGAILAKTHEESVSLNITPIDFVVCNLYPFDKTVNGSTPDQDAVEEIDIGGVTLLRAAAKNFHRVTVLTSLRDFEYVRTHLPKVPLHMRKTLAAKAFKHTRDYDDMISSFLSHENQLRYGMNPHQVPASYGDAPFKVLNGAPGYINLMDALNAFPLVKELSLATGHPAAASFKHVSPAGVAIGTNPLSETERNKYMVPRDASLSNLAIAYVKARGADRMSSFGDFVALSHSVDVSTAEFISREVSDGVIAPGFEDKALEILRKKKGGKYLVLLMDPTYDPPSMEERTIFGVKLRQRRNEAQIDRAYFSEVLCGAAPSENQLLDLLVASIALKYTQSNSVCFAKDGMTIGIGAGQQSRLHCTRLAGSKAAAWHLRSHPAVIGLKFKEGVNRAVKSTLIDQLVTGFVTEEEWEAAVESPRRIPDLEREGWLQQLKGVVLCSDAFFPFADNIQLAKTFGTETVAAPVGSVQDEAVLGMAKRLGMSFIKTRARLFHH